MHNVRHCIRLVAIGGVMALVAADTAAQALHPVEPTVAQQDVFAAVRATLADAADRTLAYALEDRSWMQEQTVSPAPASILLTNTAEPVVKLRAAIDRVRQLRPIIDPILRDEGVPSDLSAVILVESGGIPNALSSKGARGLWQLMPKTARRYGLMVSATRDERLDLEKSTRAAALYLRDLYQQLGDWQLALAAYNAGEQTVGRALSRSSEREFSRIRQDLPVETQKYVPAVLRAMLLFGQGTLPNMGPNGQLPHSQLVYARADANE